MTTDKQRPASPPLMLNPVEWLRKANFGDSVCLPMDLFDRDGNPHDLAQVMHDYAQHVRDVTREAEAAHSAGDRQPVLPGIKAVHAIITETCRENRGKAGALEEAFFRLRHEYSECVKLDCNKSAKFHVVLTVERPETPAQPSAAAGQGAQGWVSVKERLPNNYPKAVWVKGETNRVLMARYKENECCWLTDHYTIFLDYPITHWQPIVPPKED